MPTNTPTGPVPMNFINIPVTVSYWVPVFASVPTGPTQGNQSQQQPQPQPSQPSPPQQQQTFINPFQAMMQAMFTNLMTPTPPNSPHPQQQQAQQQQQQQQQSYNIPLPVLLNMMYAMGQPITPEMMTYMSQMTPDIMSFMQGGGNKPPPVTASHVINDMKKHTYGHGITPSITTCSVCQDDFAEGDIWAALPCQHPYHTDCITPWLKQHHTCPSCRYPLETDDSEYNQRAVIPTQQTWKHTFKAPPETPITCAMSHIHHAPCTLLSGNSAQVTLNCHHTYHLECLNSAQRVLSNTSHSSHGPQIITCPICHTHQTFPVQLSHLIEASTPPTTSTTTTSTTTASSTPTSQPPMMSPKEGMSPKDIDIAFDFSTTTSSSSAITSSPQSTPSTAPQPPIISSINGTATIQDDVEMND